MEKEPGRGARLFSVAILPAAPGVVATPKEFLSEGPASPRTEVIDVGEKS